MKESATSGYTPLEAQKQRNFIRYINSHDSHSVAVKTVAPHRRGFPDVEVMLPEIVPHEPYDIPALLYFVEWKRNPKSKIGKQQEVWRDRLRAMGFRVSMHSNLGEARDEFLSLLNRKGNFIGGGKG